MGRRILSTTLAAFVEAGSRRREPADGWSKLVALIATVVDMDKLSRTMG